MELKGQTLAGLINNAGIANHAVLMHQPIEEFRRVMEVNLVGTLAVTQASICALHPLAQAFVSTCCEPQKVKSCAFLMILFNVSNGGSTSDALPAAWIQVDIHLEARMNSA